MTTEEAIKFSKNHIPRQDKKYQWVFSHAKEQYERVDYTFKMLDDKADKMIRYLSPTSGILGIISILITDGRYNDFIGIISLAGITLLVISIVLAAVSLKPCSHYLLPSVKEAIEAAEYYDNDELASGSFATGIGIAIEQNMTINEAKATLIQWSYGLFVFAVALLFLLIPIAYFVEQVAC